MGCARDITTTDRQPQGVHDPDWSGLVWYHAVVVTVITLLTGYRQTERASQRVAYECDYSTSSRLDRGPSHKHGSSMTRAIPMQLCSLPPQASEADNSLLPVAKSLLATYRRRPSLTLFRPHLRGLQTDVAFRSPDEQTLILVLVRLRMRISCDLGPRNGPRPVKLRPQNSRLAGLLVF